MKEKTLGTKLLLAAVTLGVLAYFVIRPCAISATR